MASLAKAILVLLNFALLAFGAVNLLVGVALLVAKSEAVQLIHLVDSRLGEASRKEDIEIITKQGGLLTVVAYLLCAVGGFTFTVGGCGCCGAYQENSCMLYIYAVLLCLLIVLELLIVILIKFFRTNLQQSAQDALLHLQDKYYVPMSTYMDNRNSSSQKVAITHLLNMVQIWFECCGARDLGDVVQSKSWKASNRTWKGQSLVRPLTCCKVFSRAEKLAAIKPNFELKYFRDFLLDPDCPFTTKRIQWAVHNQTCAKALVDFAMSYSSWIMIACGVIVCSELIGIVLACCLINSLDEDED